MEPQVIVVAGSNDHLQSRGLLSRLTDVPRVRCLARTPSVCIHNGHDDSRGEVQRDNSCPEQSSGPRQLLPVPI